MITINGFDKLTNDWIDSQRQISKLMELSDCYLIEMTTFWTNGINKNVTRLLIKKEKPKPNTFLLEIVNGTFIDMDIEHIRSYEGFKKMLRILIQTGQIK